MYAIGCSSGDEEEDDNDDDRVSCRQNRNEIFKKKYI